MNTMKKEDMLKEQQELLERIGRMMIGVVGNAGRYAWLEGEIQKVNPIYKPAIVSEVEND